MAIYGKTDDLAGMPKYLTKTRYVDGTSATVVNAATDTITIPGSLGETGDRVYYTSVGAIGGLSTATAYYVNHVSADAIKLYNTRANAVTGGATGLINITGVGTGTADSFKLWPEDVFFVDQSEAQLASNKAKGFHGGGWYKYKTYTDANSVVRNKPIMLAELQVLPTVSGDAEDTVLGDAAITITLQPLDTTVAEPTAATFIATASVTLTNPVSVLTYQWQKAESTANTTFANIVGATSASYTTGATAVAAGAGDTHLDKYRVLVSVSGGVSMPVITSNAVTLTVTV